MFSSYDIARFSDIVYSEVLSFNQFSKLDLIDPYLIVNNDDLVFYKQKQFVIKGGDIIFTHTGNLDNLFYHLKTLDEKFSKSPLLLTSFKLSKKISLNKIQSITDKDIKGLNNLLKSYNAKAIIVRPDRFILKTCKKAKDFNQIESLPL